MKRREVYYGSICEKKKNGTKSVAFSEFGFIYIYNFFIYFLLYCVGGTRQSMPFCTEDELAGFYVWREARRRRCNHTAIILKPVSLEQLLWVTSSSDHRFCYNQDECRCWALQKSTWNVDVTTGIKSTLGSKGFKNIYFKAKLSDEWIRKQTLVIMLLLI